MISAPATVLPGAEQKDLLGMSNPQPRPALPLTSNRGALPPPALPVAAAGTAEASAPLLPSQGLSRAAALTPCGHCWSCLTLNLL